MKYPGQPQTCRVAQACQRGIVTDYFSLLKKRQLITGKMSTVPGTLRRPRRGTDSFAFCCDVAKIGISSPCKGKARKSNVTRQLNR